jgi:phospholipid/cholesterol/gamma-HCH transport system ATP-binding protein
VSAQHFYRLLRALAGSLGLTVFFLTHDRDMLVSIADRVIALAQGRVIADGPLSAVRASDDPWLQAYFATQA